MRKRDVEPMGNVDLTKEYATEGVVVGPTKVAETANRWRHLLTTYVDAALALTLVTVILYLWGFIYYQAYFNVIGVRLSVLDISFETFLLATWPDLVSGSITLASTYLLVSIVIWVVSDDEVFNRAVTTVRRKFPRIEHHTNSFFRVVGFALVCVFIIVIIISVAVSMDAKGSSAGRKQLAAKFPVNLVPKMEAGLPTPLYFFESSKDKYVLFTEDMSQGTRRIIIVAHDDIAKPEFAAP